MGRKSSIDRLDPAVRESVDRALARGATLDQVVEILDGLGADVSRSAVGRYSQRYRDMAEQQRNVMAVAKAFGEDFGAADNAAGKMLIQLINSIAIRAMVPLASGDDVDINPQDIHFLARSAKDLLSAAKIDADRDEKIRVEERRKVEAAMRKKLDEAGKQGEIDPQALIRAKRIMGFE